MIERFTVTRDGTLVNKRTGEAVPDDNRPIASPQLSRDYAAYDSPVGTGAVEGRAAHREDLKRTGCRILERGEVVSPDGKPFRPTYKNPAFALKRGLPVDG